MLLWCLPIYGSNLDPQIVRHPEELRIEALLKRADYKKAQEIIITLLSKNEISAGLRTRLFWLKAVCQISENQTDLAKASFLDLLEITPHFEAAKNTSPKILSLFAESLDAFKKKESLLAGIQATFSPIEKITAGMPYTFRIKIEENPASKMVDRIKFHVRRLGTSDYSFLDFSAVQGAPSLFEVKIPPILTSRSKNDDKFEYYVDILAKDGKILGGIGKVGTPLSFGVSDLSKNSDSPLEDGSDSSFIATTIWVSAAAFTIASAVTLTYLLSDPEPGHLHIRIFPTE